MAVNLSRRGFARLLGTGFAVAALPGRELPLRLRATDTPAAAPKPKPTAAASAAGAAEPHLVRLNANENPYGPAPAALAAMTAAFALAGRYPDEEGRQLAASVARHLGVATENVLLGEGSSELLRLAVAACPPARRRVVVADPTFEAVAAHATSDGLEVVRVPLTADYRHDLERMRAAAATAGLVYVCNPNNPTASVTPAAELRAFLAALPPETVVLVDEAYHHFADGGGYESVLPRVGELPNLLVVRTFSKIYGMAGLRCGLGVAQPALLARLRARQQWDSLNLMALVAAAASLDDDAYVEASRRRNREVRQQCCDALAARGLRVIPSQANFFMVDLGRPVTPVIAALRERGVAVGRLFPALPTHLRVTVGTREEMQAFLAAFAQVMPAAA